jgi:hypothetical protein
MLKQAIMLSVFGMSMTQVAIPAETVNREFVKVVDNTKRKAYYLSCKAQKQKDCNMKSFNASIVYKFVGE